jgi:hypothetical protein
LHHSHKRAELKKMQRTAIPYSLPANYESYTICKFFLFLQF